MCFYTESSEALKSFDYQVRHWTPNIQILGPGFMNLIIVTNPD